MSRHSATVDRQVRIELLRARAAIEREALAHSIADAGQALEPATLLRGLWPKFARGNTSQLLWQGFNLMRRYPMVSSSLSAFVMGGGKRAGLLKLAGGALAGWQLYKAWRSNHRAGRDPR
ncbi:MAG: hypothetical protein REJ50_26320 [Bordetella sp.]|nr:hypothetical protein [Bordetella sp.]